jgi:hypothetical protein
MFVSQLLPISPTLETDVVRRVRHGLADVLEWLGEEVGPKPGDKIHAIMAGTQLIVSQEFADKVAAGRHADIRQMLGMLDIRI